VATAQVQPIERQEPQEAATIKPISYTLRVCVLEENLSADEKAVRRAIETALAAVRRTLDMGHGTPVEWVVVSPLCEPAERVGVEVLWEAPYEARVELFMPFDVQQLGNAPELREMAAALDRYRADGSRTRLFQPTTDKKFACAGPCNYQGPGDNIDSRGEQCRLARHWAIDASEIVIVVGRVSEGESRKEVEYALELERLVVAVEPRADGADRVRVVAQQQPRPWSVGRLLLGMLWYTQLRLKDVPEPRKRLYALAAPTNPGAWHRVVCRCKGWLPGVWPAKRVSPGYHELDAYNRRSVPLAEVGRDWKGEMEPDEPRPARLPGDIATALRGDVFPHYFKADRLARRYQSWHQRTSRWLFYLSAAAVTVAVVNAVFFKPDGWEWLHVLEFLLLASMIAWYGVARWANWHTKWLNGRYLAESLRQALYAGLTGLRPEQAPDYPTRFSFYKGPKTWLSDYASRLEDRVVAAARKAYGLGAPPSAVGLPDRPPVTCKALDVGALKDYVLAAWVRAQQAYHKKTAARQEFAEKVYEYRGQALFLLTLLAIAGHLFLARRPELLDAPAEQPAGVESEPTGREPAPGPGPVLKLWWHLPPWSMEVLTLLTIVLPAWGSAIYAIKNQLEFRRMAERSENMKRLLQFYPDRFRNENTLEGLHRVVSAAREAMGTENYEWWILLGFRDPALPS
jgi:hypothetical protein